MRHDKSLESGRLIGNDRKQVAAARLLNGDESSYLWRMYKFRNATPAASIEWKRSVRYD